MDFLTLCVCVEPALQPRQILAPVERTVDQVLPAVFGSTDGLIEVGEIVWPDHERFAGVPHYRASDTPGDERPAQINPLAEPAGRNKEHRVGGQDMAMAYVKIARQRCHPIYDEQHEKRQHRLDTPV